MPATIAAPTPELHRLLSTQELADKLGVSSWCIFDATRNRGLPVVKFGRRNRYDPVAVRRWLDAGGELRDRDA